MTKNERIQVLEIKLASLKREITIKDNALQRKNILLDGLGMVWCDGGCQKGVGRFTDIELTEEMVSEVERNTKRLRTYWSNTESRREALKGNQND